MRGFRLERAIVGLQRGRFMIAKGTKPDATSEVKGKRVFQLAACVTS